MGMNCSKSVSFSLSANDPSAGFRFTFYSILLAVLTDPGKGSSESEKFVFDKVKILGGSNAARSTIKKA
jgi:hypothetical protein